jgi:hypothetical protein
VTDTPLFFGDGGVRPKPLEPTAQWIWRTTTVTVVDSKPQILAQMNATATQQQRLLTLEQARIAEEKRAEEQIAKAKADNAYRNSIGLNVEEFVQLQLADKAVQACAAAKECVVIPPGVPMVVAK